MPTYEFVCTECGNRIEVFQRVDEESPAVCEVCGGALRKVFHPAGIVLKGSGFYKTDSRSGSSKKTTANAPSKEPAKEPAKTEKVTEAKKPETKKPADKKEKSA